MRPPTWRSAINRAAISTVLFVVLVILLFKQPIGASLGLGAFVFLFYIPLTLGFFSWSLYGGKTTLGYSALFVPLGVLTWIGMEYSLHRYFFHWEGMGPFTKTEHPIGGQGSGIPGGHVRSGAASTLVTGARTAGAAEPRRCDIAVVRSTAM